MNQMDKTIILNKNDDGFLDLNSSHELSEVMKVLKKIDSGGYDN